MLLDASKTAWRRRQFLKSLAAGGAFFTSRGLFAQALTTTPAQTLGPYYPDRMPLDQDNDLIVQGDSLTPAVGEITWLSGRVPGQNRKPRRNALVEIWQADRNGAYIHTASPISNRDPNFQGYGQIIDRLHRRVSVPERETGAVSRPYAPYPLPAHRRERAETRDAVVRAGRSPERNGRRAQWHSRHGAAKLSDRAMDADCGFSRRELQANFDIIFGFTPADPPMDRPVILAQNGVVNGAAY